jgi:hypothetical protein
MLVPEISMYRAKDAKVHSGKMIGPGARLTMSRSCSWLACRDDRADQPGFTREARTKTEGFKVFLEHAHDSQTFLSIIHHNHS